MTPDAPRPDLDEAERIWREWTPSTPKSVRPLLAELTRLRAALAERDSEIARLRAVLPREPRVWFDGDEVPAGVWTYRAEADGYDEDRIEMLGTDGEPCGNGNLGPLVEIVLPADIDGIVERARQERGVDR